MDKHEELEIPALSPPMGLASEPPLWQLGEYHFEDFCRELWASEGVDCQGYGTRGQTQYGIDLITRGDPPGASSVGQCKAGVVSASLVEGAVDAFIKHLSGKWKSEDIRVFRLYTAHSCKDTKVQDEISTQHARLKEQGVELQVYDNGRIVHRARKQVPLVGQYCGGAWVDSICGGNAKLWAPEAVVATALSFSSGEVYQEWDSERDQQIEAIRESLRCGFGERAYSELSDLVGSSRFQMLSNGVRAKALKVLAVLEIDHSADLEKAQEILDRAKEANAEADFQIAETLLAHHKGDHSRANELVATPRSVGAWNLLLAFMINEGESNRVIDSFESPPFDPNAESIRLKAMALLMVGNVSDALEAIELARADKPDWIGVQHTYGVVSYSAAVSNAFYAWSHLTWCVPCSWEYVKLDDRSQQRMQDAATVFEALLEKEGASSDSTERLDLETWYAGSLGNLPERQKDAERFINDSLQSNPGHYRLATWAMERGYDFDASRVLSALSHRIEEGDHELDAVSACVHLQADSGQLSEALETLNLSRESFSRSDSIEAWRFLVYQLLAQQGNWEEAEKHSLEGNDDTRIRCEAYRARIEAAQDSSRQKELCSALKEKYSRTKKAADLLEASIAHLSAGDFHWVTQHASALTQAFPNPGVFALVVRAHAAIEENDVALALIDEAIESCPGQTLPEDLRRLKVQCLRGAGKLAEADALASALISDTLSLGNLLERFETQVSIGDVEGIVETASTLLQHQEAKPAELLRASLVVAPVNRHLAVDLWTRAISDGDYEKSLAPLALHIAHKLGLKSGTAELMRDMMRLAEQGEGGVIGLTSAEDVAQLLRSQQEELTKANSAYNGGKLPIHALSDSTGEAIAALYHSLLSENESSDSLLRRPALLARHGGRPIGAPLDIEPGTVTLDVTSLLLANHLGILDIFEQHLAPLRISAWLQRCLGQQLVDLKDHDEDTLSARALAVELVESGQVKTHGDVWPIPNLDDGLQEKMGVAWCSMLALAKSNEGIVIDSFPLTETRNPEIPVALGGDDAKFVGSIGALLAAAEEEDVISSEEHETACSTIGHSLCIAGGKLNLETGKNLYLSPSFFEPLAASGILVKLAEAYCISVCEPIVRRLAAQNETSARRRSLAEWLRSLLNRVRRGIKDGTYETFTHRLPKEFDDDSSSARLATRCLLDLVPRPDSAPGTICCDDRMINVHLASEIGSVISIYDVLGHLRRNELLSDSRYFECLIRCRKGNVRHFPVTAEEILFHLAIAQVSRSGVVETPELAALRRSTAAALLDADLLSRPPASQLSPDNPGELRWVMDLMQAAAEAIQELWQSTGTIEQITHRSNWIIDAIHIDILAVQKLFTSYESANAGKTFAAGLGRLFLAGLSLPSVPPTSDDRGRSKRFQFFSWLDRRILDEALRFNKHVGPELGTLVRGFLEKYFDSYCEAASKEELQAPPQRSAALQVLWMHADLPETLHEFDCLPAAAASELAPDAGASAFVIDGEAFLFEDFLSAVARSFAGNATEIGSVGGTACTIHSAEGDQPVFISIGDTTTRVEIRMEYLPILAADTDTREAFLGERPDLFDMLLESRGEEIRRLASIEEPIERYRAVEGLAANSPETQFRRMRSLIEPGAPVNLEHLFLSDISNLPAHIRLPNHDAPDWELAATKLEQEEGIAVAIKRFACLPRLLPSYLVSKACSVAAPEFENLYQSLISIPPSPIEQLNLLHLLVNRSSDASSDCNIVEELLQAVLDTDSVEPRFNALRDIAAWCATRLRLDERANQWSSTELIASIWAHASRVYELLQGGAVTDNEMQEWFQRERRSLPVYWEPHHPAHLEDVSYPQNVHWRVMLCRSLGSTLSSVNDQLATSLRPTVEELDRAIAGDPPKGESLLELGAETLTRKNALSSYLGGDWLPPLASIYPEELLRQRFFETPESFVLARLSEVEENPLNFDSWCSLWILVGDAPFYPTQQDRLRRLMTSIDLDHILRQGGHDAYPALRFLTAQAAHCGSPEIRANFRSALIQALGFSHSDRQTDKDTFGDLAANIMEAALLLSRSEVDDEQSFTELAVDLIRSCPEAAKTLRGAFGNVMEGLPLDYAASVWPLHLAVRAAV